MDTNEYNNLPIGVFDSGAGGLTVVKEILRNLPSEKIIYFGDTARVPYGNKSPETVIRYSRQIAGFLESMNVKAITVACNTASALALETVRQEFDIPMIGVVVPGSEAAVAATRNHRIGVTGTSGTVKSGIYERLIKSLDPEAEVFSQACPLFVHLVEEDMIDDPVTVSMIHRYLDGLITEHNIDTLILGCTHYPLLLDVLERETGGRRCTRADICGQKETAAADEKDRTDPCETDACRQKEAGSRPSLTLVNPAYETSLSLKRMLDKYGIAADPGRKVSAEDHRYFVSDDAENFRDFAQRVLKIRVTDVSLKVLE